MNGKDKTSSRAAALTISLLAAYAAGAAGSLFTAAAVETWYPALTKPPFTPPPWVFGPAWTVLYTLMGIAAFLVWKHREIPPAARSLRLYAAHLLLNAGWSGLFFGLRSPALGLAGILLLLAVIAFLTLRFYRIKKAAGILFIPYLGWTAFAAVLNTSILILN